MGEIDPLDRPVHGALAIADVLNFRDAKGNLKRKTAYYYLEAGLLDADKLGAIWTSTPRRLLKLPRSGA